MTRYPKAAWCPGCGLFLAVAGKHRSDCTSRKAAVAEALNRMDTDDDRKDQHAAP